MSAETGRFRGGLVLVALGLGLIAAPAVFRMFTRAPLGAEMIDEFRPYMNTESLDGFSTHLAVIAEAHAEAAPVLSEVGSSDFPSAGSFVEEWPAIQRDMTEMLSIIRDNIDNFEAVDALPRFSLFPWFFVAPGLILVALGILAVRRPARARSAVAAAALLGVGLIAAPAIFQMFSRAPLGGRMIQDFVPIMTESNVGQVQAYFLVIAGAEGEFRNRVKPALQQRKQLSDSDYAASYRGLAAFEERWPRIAAGLAPMVGAMSDNVDNFDAVDSLPPFPLFPWFFVVPGVIIAFLSTYFVLTAGESSVLVVAEGGLDES